MEGTHRPPWGRPGATTCRSVTSGRSLSSSVQRGRWRWPPPVTTAENCVSKGRDN